MMMMMIERLVFNSFLVCSILTKCCTASRPLCGEDITCHKVGKSVAEGAISLCCRRNSCRF